MVQNDDGSYSLAVERMIVLTNKKGEEFEISGIEVRGEGSGTAVDGRVYAGDIQFTCCYLDKATGKWIPIDSSYPVKANGSIELMISGQSKKHMISAENAQDLYYKLDGVYVTIGDYKYHIVNGTTERERIAD